MKTRFRRRPMLPLICLLLACGGAEAPPEPAPAASTGPPNVLLLTVDTLRPDALGWVAGANDTPALDRLARQGFRFPAAVSPAPLTAPAHLSMLTGLLPRRHGVRDNGQLLPPGPLTLAEALTDHGYATAAFVSGFPLAARFGLDRGFEHYDDTFTAGEGAWLERKAPETTAAVLGWLESAREPFFLWVHYYDPHLPYEPPAAFAGSGGRGTYDGEVAYADRAIGKLLAAVEARGDLLTVFAADHGESLGEHGEGSHGFFVYDSTVRVPMVVSWPGRLTPGESGAPARLLDLAPTVLDLLGLPPLGEVDGVSLAPLLAGEAQEIPPAYVETQQPWLSYGWAPLAGVRTAEWKLIAAPRPELYHLSEDPHEENNLFDQRRREAAELREQLRRIEARPQALAAAVTDSETLARLRALGYAGGGAPAQEPPTTGLPDPKDMADLREMLTQGDELLRHGDFGGARDAFERVLGEDPGNRFALLRSGVALMRLDRLPAAVARLERAVELAPAQPEARGALGEALARSGDLDGAAAQWLEVLRLQPKDPAAWSQLGSVLGMKKEIPRAVEAMQRAVELAPEDPDLVTRLAFAEHAAGDSQAAAGHLLEAAGLYGEKSFAHAGSLGILLAELGRSEEAREWLGKSRPGEADFAEARYRLALLEAEAGDEEAARRALAEALRAAPQLGDRAAAEPRLSGLIADTSR